MAQRRDGTGVSRVVIPQETRGVSMLLTTNNFGPLSTTSDPLFLGSSPLMTVRADDGNWLSTWANVLTVAGPIHGPGFMRNLACTTTASAETYLFVLIETNSTGHIVFALRRADTTWHAWDSLFSRAGNLYDANRVACAAIGNSIHVVAATRTSGLQHAMRTDSGTWEQWGDVLSVAGPLSNVEDVAVAGIRNDLHVLVRVSPFKLMHTIRFADRTWQKWAEVAVPYKFQTSAPGGLACTGAGSELHVVFGSDSLLYASVRNEQGAWWSWEPIASLQGKLAKTAALAAERDGALQAVVGDGSHSLFHSRRPAGGIWVPFRDVLEQAANFVTIESVGMAPVTRVL